MSVLGDVIRAVDPELAPYAITDPPRGEWESRLEESAERGSADRAFVLEAVYEGFLMHYGEPRAFAGMDPDLRLLAGDALYALGLERLAERGDLPAVAELADLISACAQAQAEGRPEAARALWEGTMATPEPGAKRPYSA